MSSYLYGALSRRRHESPSNAELVFANVAPVPATAARAQPQPPVQVTSEPDPVKDKVRYWLDAVAALVPAEVLALHGVAMSYGTTTTGTGENAVTRITHPTEMMVVYVGMMVVAAGLYLLGAKSLKGLLTWARAVIAVAAFVVWTMIQPSTAFDAFPFGLSAFGRIMIAVFGAIVLAALVNVLASKADKT
jgi:hypothetical protein